MYPEELIAPMREELTNFGFKNLPTPQDVDTAIAQSGTTLLVINSVCGCGAATARPGVLDSLEVAAKKPDHLVTSFAGFDIEAVKQARTYLQPYLPSSPSIALFKDGQLVHMVERHMIEGNSAEHIAEHLKKAYEAYC